MISKCSFPEVYSDWNADIDACHALGIIYPIRSIDAVSEMTLSLRMRHHRMSLCSFKTQKPKTQSLMHYQSSDSPKPKMAHRFISQLKNLAYKRIVLSRPINVALPRLMPDCSLYFREALFLNMDGGRKAIVIVGQGQRRIGSSQPKLEPLDVHQVAFLPYSPDMAYFKTLPRRKKTDSKNDVSVVQVTVPTLIKSAEEKIAEHLRIADNIILRIHFVGGHLSPDESFIGSGTTIRFVDHLNAEYAIASLANEKNLCQARMFTERTIEILRVVMTP